MLPGSCSVQFEPRLALFARLKSSVAIVTGGGDGGGGGGGGGGGDADAAPPKKMPLITELGPPVPVNLKYTCPPRVQDRYFPLEKLETVRVSNTLLLPASNTSTVSALPALSQSRK